MKNMINILITGSTGFIGKNLIKYLNSLSKKINILEFNRNDTFDKLENLIVQADYIFHLAGEVRPSSSDTEFKNSNVNLTKTMVDFLNKNNKKTPILLASSIHAQLLKNSYGITKRDSEILIEKYSINNSIQSLIYRLPHVFGEGCKPNYNSVISTWIYSSIHDKEINVFDRNIEMNYVYVQDIIIEFMNLINSNSNDLYITPNRVFQTTLGEVVDLINEFKNNIDNKEYRIDNQEFKSKLFITYKDYLRKEVYL